MGCHRTASTPAALDEVGFRGDRRIVAGRGRPPQATARRAGLEGEEEVLTATFTSTDLTERNASRTGGGTGWRPASPGRAMLARSPLLARAPRRPGRRRRRPPQARPQPIGHDLDRRPGAVSSRPCPRCPGRQPGVCRGHRTVPHGLVMDARTVASPQPGTDRGLCRWCAPLLGRPAAARAVPLSAGLRSSARRTSDRMSALRPRCPLGQGSGSLLLAPSAAGPVPARTTTGSGARPGPRCGVVPPDPATARFRDTGPHAA